MSTYRNFYLTSISSIFALVFSLPVFFSGILYAAEGVVINEILYNPSDDYSSEYEYVELYNPTSQSIDLSGYAFTDGIAYRFPSGTSLLSKNYLVIARNPSLAIWQNRGLQIVGPFNGELENGGELLRFRSPNGNIVEEMRYDDFSPWPRGADGYGSSLERIGASEASENPYSWRASTTLGGTPGLVNSIADLPARPVVVSWTVTPPYPKSTEEVQIESVLEGSLEDIFQVDLQYEVWDTLVKGTKNQVTMENAGSEADRLIYRATVPAQVSQSLVRFNWRIYLKTGKNLVLPHDAEPRPFESYFVYDSEMASRLPILWLFPDFSTNLSITKKTVRGVVVKPLESEHVELYDGARIENSLVDDTGRKIKFLKGEEFRNDRTINLSPESPTHPNSGGADTNHKEDLGFQVFRDQGVYAPRCDWYRVIESGAQGQRTATQQVNEKFLEINDLDTTSNIYKIAYNEGDQVPGRSISYAKQTNIDFGSDDLFEFFEAIQDGSATSREKAIRQYLDLDEVIGYSVAGVLISNWDGFFNNMFLIHIPFPIDLWECVPWDLDKTFGYTDGYPPQSTSFARMPLEFPLNGQAEMASRQAGPVSEYLHQVEALNEEYLQRVRDALNGTFSLEVMNQKIDAIQALLLEDLQMEADYTGVYRTRRKNQIQNAYNTVRTFLTLRHEYLRPLLFTPVNEWSLY